MPEIKDVKIDLTQLKNTIASGKKAQHEKQVALGNVPEGAIMKSNNKRSFLNELVTSMHSGVKTSAVEAITAVNETVEYKKGVPQAVAKNKNGGRTYAPPRRSHVNENTQPQQQVHRTGASDWGMAGNGSVNVNPHGNGGGYNGGDGERELDFSKINAEFDQRMMNNNPMVAQNPRMKHMMSQYGGQTQQPQYEVEGVPQQLNEQMENMEKNMEKIVESNLKSVLTNIYTKQKIQESLIELLQSDDGLKILARAINEIAKKNKANQQKK